MSLSTIIMASFDCFCFFCLDCLFDSFFLSSLPWLFLFCAFFLLHSLHFISSSISVYVPFNDYAKSESYRIIPSHFVYILYILVCLVRLQINNNHKRRILCSFAHISCVIKSRVIYR